MAVLCVEEIIVIRLWMSTSLWCAQGRGTIAQSILALISHVNKDCGKKRKKENNFIHERLMSLLKNLGYNTKAPD